MRTLRQIETWTAALCAVTAAGSIVAFLCGANPRSYMLIAAEAVATMGVFSLLSSVLAAEFLVRRRTAGGLAVWASSDQPRSVDCAACLSKRREVLDQRLNVDAPHLCSQYGVACTCWSFCASVDRTSENVFADGAPSPAQTPERVRTLSRETQGLPLVHRSGMDNCQFRFVPIVAAPAADERAAPISPTAATARR